MNFEGIEMEVKCDLLNERSITTLSWTSKMSSLAKAYFCAFVFPHHNTTHLIYN